MGWTCPVLIAVVIEELSLQDARLWFPSCEGRLGIPILSYSIHKCLCLIMRETLGKGT